MESIPTFRVVQVDFIFAFVDGKPAELRAEAVTVFQSLIRIDIQTIDNTTGSTSTESSRES